MRDGWKKALYKPSSSDNFLSLQAKKVVSFLKVRQVENCIFGRSKPARHLRRIQADSIDGEVEYLLYMITIWIEVKGSIIIKLPT